MLVQICPRGTGGVRDYAACLARAWTVRGIASHLIEGNDPVPGETTLGARLEGLMQAQVDRAAKMSIVLHFSGYGYASRGLCQWLVDELTLFMSRRRDQVRLVVMFHELFATSAPWRSAFWLAPAQSRIARRLAMLADEVWTNTEHHARWLRQATGSARQVTVRPVFSNVGEPVDMPQWSQRRPQAVVFGSPSTRRRALGGIRRHATTLRSLGIAAIVEVGDGPAQLAELTAPDTCHLGRLDSAALSALLLGSRFGLLEYPARFLGKSGVFAAYAAHGCVAIDIGSADADRDGLRAGIDYLRLPFPHDGSSDDHPGMAQRLNRWYGPHCLALQAGELLASARA
jgi:hypothetical protein